MERFLRLVGRTPWFIEPNRAVQMMEALETRLELGSRSEPYLSAEEVEANRVRAQVDMIPMASGGKGERVKNLARIPLIGAIVPRGSAMEDMSGGGTVGMTRFQSEFMNAANDPNVGAILLEVDSPGGELGLVPETARMIRNARRAGRPIVAIANTMAASAAYWLASAADEVVVTPSGMVGSIGVFTVHEDHSEALKRAGVQPSFIYEGARKVEGNPFGPLDAEARAALQASVRAAYESFTADVAEFRGASVRTVRADPEAAEKSFGGGRAYSASMLKERGLIGEGGMVDRVATQQDTVNRLLGRSRRTSTKKARLALL